MRKALLLMLFVWVSTPLYAQEKEVELSTLKAPSSPAFAILGVLPNEISRPKSYKAFETELLSNFIGDNNSLVLPNNYALEITPFWLFTHPNLTLSEYANPEIWQTIPRSFSLSMSTNEEVLSDSLTFKNLGLGGRFTLDFRSIDREKFDRIYNKLDNIQAATSAVDRLIVNTFDGEDKFDNARDIERFIHEEAKIELQHLKNAEAKEYFNFGVSQLLAQISTLSDSAEIQSKFGDKKYMAKLMDLIEDEARDMFAVKENAEGLADIIQEKHGFSIEFAFAAKYGFSNNEGLSKSEFKKFGFWVTPSYKPKGVDFLEFLGIVRYIRNDTGDLPELDLNNLDSFSKNLDFGLRLVFTSPAEKNPVPFSVSLEWLRRTQWVELEEEIIGNTSITRTIRQNDSRLSFTFEYRISDNINFAYSVGRAFDKNTLRSEQFFTLAGLTFGFGGKKASDFSEID